MTTKLATIVAIDVAGFSALAEANEDAAIAAVGRLHERAEKCARNHGGRVFNTAGDSVMMEFASVAHAVEAAAELAAHPDPPIRVGVHLGEVSEMANGDLLGHGVNVAARLQQLAQPGAVIVSEDARRALRGALADRLVEKGVVKLDKIDESIGIYELTAQASDAAPADIAHRKARQSRLIAIGAVVALAAGVALFLAWPMLTRPPAPRVAVFSLSAPEDAQTLATGVADDITLALTASGVEAIARAETAGGTREERIDRAGQLGATLALDGVVEQQRNGQRVTLNIVRTADRTTLWSQAFEASSDDTEGLRQRAAERTADVLACGVNVVRQKRTQLRSETFALLLRACGSMREQNRMMETRDTLAQVVEQEPNLAYAHALLALSEAMAIDEAPETMREGMRQRARAEAERARRADPTIGESYIALSLLERPMAWDARERFLREGFVNNERSSALNNFYSVFLLEVGRVGEAVRFARRGVELDPLSTSKRRSLARALLLSGDAAGARDIVEAMAAAYSEDRAHWAARLLVATWGGREDEALVLINAPMSGARTPRTRACMRDTIQAFRADAAAAASARVLTCYRAGDITADDAIAALSARGDLDHAFEVARTGMIERGDTSTSVLFSPAAGPMRADARFMPLVNELGLLRYWNLNDRWPDFCGLPGLPYECRAEAARLR